ncbi:hypothetical protein PV726_49505 [Streptomyces europaeiscabiei]|uniref:hypothetical protein n=1 Tax=Streptomyces europaeiscabiei TaxID=146819 RepID=UPI0029BA9689|nr:hypothetical protein [Streptomyces europaeiscabiei]MDX3698043.1 hypothetical protein [Streptomyces europaeiscabiei]
MPRAVNGERVPQQRRQAPDAFVPFLDFCRQRLADERHLWTSTLFDEIVQVGHAGAAHSTGRPTVDREATTKLSKQRQQGEAAADAVIRDDGEKPEDTAYTPQSSLVEPDALLRWARAAGPTATPHTEGDAASQLRR